VPGCRYWDLVIYHFAMYEKKYREILSRQVANDKGIRSYLPERSYVTTPRFLDGLSSLTGFERQ
jgi:hypothetical protein